MTSQTAAKSATTPEQAAAMPQLQAAPVANDNAVELARDKLPPVEQAAVHAPEAIMPPPHVELPKPPQAVGEVVTSAEVKADNLIVLPEMVTHAEQRLAAHIGAEIDPMLAKNLVLSVSSNLEKGKTNFVLSFTGDMVAANPAVMGEQVMAALHKLPAMQGLIAEHHQPHARLLEGKLEVVIPHLATAQYAQLMQALAAGVEEKQTAEMKQNLPTHTSDAPATTVEGPAHVQATIVSSADKENAR